MAVIIYYFAIITKNLQQEFPKNRELIKIIVWRCVIEVSKLVSNV